MKRTVCRPSNGRYLVPADFEAKAQPVLDQMPEEWHEVQARPRFDDDDLPTRYVGATWVWIKDGLYVAIATMDCDVLDDPKVRDYYLDKVRKGFARNARSVKDVPRAEGITHCSTL